MNKPPHRLQTNDLTNRLLKLMDNELISFEQNEKICYPSCYLISEFLESISKIPVTKLASGELEWNLLVQLTAKGGSYWESMFNPQWNRFHIHSISFGESEDESNWDLEYGCLTLLHRSINIQKQFFNILEGEIPVERVSPWQATYWKTLSEGHKASFTVRGDYFDVIPQSAREELNNLHTWRKNWKHPYKRLLEITSGRTS